MANTYLTDFWKNITSTTYKPYETGLPFMDSLLGGGVTKGTVTLLLAAPGSGKTALAQQWAESIARNMHTPVLYVNLEMSREQMLARALSLHLAEQGKKHSTKEILQGYKWDDETKVDATWAFKDYRENSDPYITYLPKSEEWGTVEGLKARLDELTLKAKTDGKEAPVLILDYLHLVGSTQNMDRQELLKKVLMTIKTYCMEANTFALVISATNRSGGEGGKVSMSSGRDSSNIEYSGDVIISLNYYEVDKSKKGLSEDELDVLKKASPREMILRLHKARFDKPGITKCVYYMPAYNFFYGPDTATDFPKPVFGNVLKEPFHGAMVEEDDNVKWE